MDIDAIIPVASGICMDLHVGHTGISGPDHDACFAREWSRVIAKGIEDYGIKLQYGFTGNKRCSIKFFQNQRRLGDALVGSGNVDGWGGRIIGCHDRRPSMKPHSRPVIVQVNCTGFGLAWRHIDHTTATDIYFQKFVTAVCDQKLLQWPHEPDMMLQRIRSCVDFPIMHLRTIQLNFRSRQRKIARKDNKCGKQREQSTKVERMIHVGE